MLQCIVGGTYAFDEWSLWSFMTIVKIVFVTLLVLVTKANAEDCSTGICLNYQNDFGSVLIGSVNVQQGVIWGIQDSSIFTEDDQFAFVGPEAYYNQLTFKPSNEWVVEGISYIHLKNPDLSNTKKIGLFFAPQSVGERTTQLIANGKAQVNLLRGVGVADNAGLIGLKVDVYRRNSTENCISSGKGGISATCTLLNYPVKISAKDNLSFVITPTIADTQQANYAKLLVAGIDIESSPDPNQKCYSSVAKDQIPLNTNKRPVGEGFVEFISQSAPSKLSTVCSRYHSGFFIAEMNKSFEFQTSVTNMSATRSLEYRFYIEGHKSAPTGNVTVKLSSNVGTTTPTTPTAPVVSEQQIKDGCKANPISCGITVVNEQEIKNGCQANPISCGIAPTEQSTFGNDLKLIIPSVKSGNDTFKPVEMSLIEGGWITEQGTGSHVFKVDKLNDISPFINAEAKGVLRLMGSVAVVTDAKNNPITCDKSCKLKLNDVVRISAKDAPVGSTIAFEGDCEQPVVNNTCKVTINKPYQVVVVSTTPTTPTTPTTSKLTITKKGTGEVKVFVGGTLSKTCGSDVPKCEYQYPQNTQMVIRAVDSKAAAPFDTLPFTADCPDKSGNTGECRSYNFWNDETIVVSF